MIYVHVIIATNPQLFQASASRRARLDCIRTIIVTKIYCLSSLIIIISKQRSAWSNQVEKKKGWGKLTNFLLLSGGYPLSVGPSAGKVLNQEGGFKRIAQSSSKNTLTITQTATSENRA